MFEPPPIIRVGVAVFLSNLRRSFKFWIVSGDRSLSSKKASAGPPTLKVQCLLRGSLSRVPGNISVTFCIIVLFIFPCNITKYKKKLTGERVFDRISVLSDLESL